MSIIKGMILSLLIMLVLLCSSAVAEPWLACDPSADAITKVKVEITYGNLMEIRVGSYIISPTNPNNILLLDLADFMIGQCRLRAQWSVDGLWWSGWSDVLVVDVMKTAKPGLLRLVIGEYKEVVK